MRNWTDLSLPAFRDLDPEREIALLPLGATEQHGPHLPVATDTILAEGVLQRAAERLDPRLSILVLPSQPVTLSPEHAEFPGTLTLSSHTVLNLWTEIGDSVARAGIRKLVLFNGHGGNVSAMDLVARDLRVQCGLWVAHTSWFALADQRLLAANERRQGIHAGQLETSAMLALAPDKVTMSLAQVFHSRGDAWEQEFSRVGIGGKSAKLGWLMSDLNQAGAVGNAAAASAELGNALLDSAAQGLADFLDEFDRMSIPEQRADGA